MSVTHGWLPELFAAGAALLYGVGAFVLVRALYPLAFVRALQHRREELRASQAAIRSGGWVARLRRAVMALPSFGRLVVQAFIDSLGTLVAPLVRDAWAERMKRKFMAMGQPQYRPEDFRVRQLLYAVVLGTFGFVVLLALNRSWVARVFAALALGAGGFALPYVWLHDQIAKRHKAIQRALPYHLDLMTLSIEAGLDFTQGLATVVERGRSGPLLEELGIMVSEMKLGKTREEGLRNLADRVQLAEVTSFVSTLIQADKMGTSLGKVLRIQSGQMRVLRAQQAEKAANEAPVKMLVPLVLCFFPTMFIILFGPIIYRMMYGG